MKKSHLILSAIILVSIAVLGFKSKTQEKQYQYATIKVSEEYSEKRGNNSLVVFYPDGQQEIVQLDHLDYRDEIPQNAIKISAKINELGKSGYKLVTQSSFGSTMNIHFTTYVFIKE